MIFDIYIYILLSLLAVLLVNIIYKKDFYNRILSLNSFSSIVIALIVIIASKKNDNYIIDIALVYVLFSYVAIIGFLKFFLKNK